MNQSDTAPDASVSLANWRTAPFNRWAFRHVRNVLPTAEIRCGADAVPLPRRALPLVRHVFSDRHGALHQLDGALRATHTDAFMVVHRGIVLDERYYAGMQPDDQHIAMSVSKSLTAVLAGALTATGQLDPEAPVASYVPEVCDTAYAAASVRHLLDMRAAVDFDEDYLATSGRIIAYREAAGWNPPSDPADPGDLRSFLLTLESDGAHGGRFRYTSPNSDLLGWVLERAGGRPLADLLSSHFWRPLGAERDAYVAVDRLGAPRPAGGICLTLRDLARVGLMMLAGGLVDGRLVVPHEWVEDTVQGGDEAAFAAGDFAEFLPGARYRNQWYQLGNDLNAFCGLGIHGQFLYVAPATATVIVRFASHPIPLDEPSEALMLALFDSIARALG